MNDIHDLDDSFDIPYNEDGPSSDPSVDPITAHAADSPADDKKSISISLDEESHLDTINIGLERIFASPDCARKTLDPASSPSSPDDAGAAPDDSTDSADEECFQHWHLKMKSMTVDRLSDFEKFLENIRSGSESKLRIFEMFIKFLSEEEVAYAHVVISLHSSSSLSEVLQHLEVQHAELDSFKEWERDPEVAAHTKLVWRGKDGLGYLSAGIPRLSTPQFSKDVVKTEEVSKPVPHTASEEKDDGRRTLRKRAQLDSETKVKYDMDLLEKFKKRHDMSLEDILVATVLLAEKEERERSPEHDPLESQEVKDLAPPSPYRARARARMSMDKIDPVCECELPPLPADEMFHGRVKLLPVKKRKELKDLEGDYLLVLDQGRHWRFAILKNLTNQALNPRYYLCKDEEVAEEAEKFGVADWQEFNWSFFIRPTKKKEAPKGCVARKSYSIRCPSLEGHVYFVEFVEGLQSE